MPEETVGHLDGNILSRYINLNLEGNKIGEIGCKGLSRGNWPSLEQVNLGKNVLKNVKTNWGKGTGLPINSKWRRSWKYF